MVTKSSLMQDVAELAMTFGGQCQYASNNNPTRDQRHCIDYAWVLAFFVALPLDAKRNSTNSNLSKRNQ